MIARHSVCRTAAFTLTEFLVALGIGIFVINVAIYAFMYDQKLINKIEVIGAKNDVAASMVLWTISKQYSGTSYPAGPQFRQIGAAALTYVGSDQYFLLQIQDWSKNLGPNPPYTVGKLTIPVTEH